MNYKDYVMTLKSIIEIGRMHDYIKCYINMNYVYMWFFTLMYLSILSMGAICLSFLTEKW